MSTEVETPVTKRRRTSTIPTPPPVSSSTSEEGELTSATEREHLAEQISQDLQNASRDVMQKDARYFMLADVVCSHCGMKGHMSFDCPEEVAEIRCFLCGAQGHNSRECPNDGCYLCRKSGHRARDCPDRGQRRKVVRRDIAPARDFVMDCYVCGQLGHLDCSIEKMARGILSCYNCGMTGHAGSGCTIPSAEKIIPVVRDMDRERRASKSPRSKKKQTEEDRAEHAAKFRESFMEKARQTRYGRGGGG